MERTIQWLDKLNKGHKPRVECTCAFSSKNLTNFAIRLIVVTAHANTYVYTGAYIRLLFVFLSHIYSCKISMNCRQIISHK